MPPSRHILWRELTECCTHRPAAIYWGYCWGSNLLGLLLGLLLGPRQQSRGLGGLPDAPAAAGAPWYRGASAAEPRRQRWPGPRPLAVPCAVPVLRAGAQQKTKLLTQITCQFSRGSIKSRGAKTNCCRPLGCTRRRKHTCRHACMAAKQVHRNTHARSNKGSGWGRATRLSAGRRRRYCSAHPQQPAPSCSTRCWWPRELRTRLRNSNRRSDVQLDARLLPPASAPLGEPPNGVRCLPTGEPPIGDSCPDRGAAWRSGHSGCSSTSGSGDHAGVPLAADNDAHCSNDIKWSRSR